MDERPERTRKTAPRTRVSGRAALDWAHVLRQSSLDAALEAIARSLARGGRFEGVLEVGEPGGVPLGRHAGETRVEPGVRRDVEIPGRPPWRLTLATRRDRAWTPAAFRQAAEALTAWRAAREEIDRHDRRLEHRARELAVLQELGRAGAEARTPERLFTSAARLLHRGAGIEALAVASSFGSRARTLAFLARPLPPARVEWLGAQAWGSLGGPGPDPPSPELIALDGFEEARGGAPVMRPEDLAVVPIVRGGRPVAAIAVFLPDGEEARLRLVFGAANQVTLHLDRILTVREAEQDRFRSILESMPQAVVLTDPALRVMQANPAAGQLLEAWCGGSPGGPVSRLGDLDLPPLVEGLRAERGRTMEREARVAGGKILHVTLSPVRGEAKDLEGIVLVIADVTEQRRLQEQMAQTEKLSSLGQMISGIAHELNNPLASVLGFSQLARTATSDDKLARRLATIHDEARRCQRIVQNLLSFARRHAPERRPVSLNEVVRSVMGLVGYQLRVGNVAVRTELDPDLPSLYGDWHQLQQMIVNLVTNAQQAIRDSGAQGTITLTTRAVRGARVTLEVRDDGPGIAEQDLSRIYDPFFTTKESGRGTGLGLSLVYAIVSSHGGTIQCRSRSGEGTVFVIELPVGSAEAPGAELPPATPVATPGAAPGRILVVDDEEVVARLICEALTADGHRVVQAQDREEALRHAEREEFDLVVVDHKMPGLSDETFGGELERRRPGLGRRMLLVTGDTVSQEPERTARRMGVDLLHKPFDLEDLLRAVRSRLAST